MEPSIERPVTLEVWKLLTAVHARKVADNVDNVMKGNSPDPTYSLKSLKDMVSQLEELGLSPAGDEEFQEYLALIRAQGPGGLNTDAIRSVADYFDPPKNQVEN